MSQQMDTNMASKALHENCNKTNADSNGSVVDIGLSSDARVDGMPFLPKCIESNVETSVDTTPETRLTTTVEKASDSGLESSPESTQSQTEISVQSMNEVVIQKNVETSIETNGEPTLTTDSSDVDKCVPKAESSGESSQKYIRRTSTESMVKIWELIDSKEWHKNVDQMNKSLAKEMFDLFNIKLNEHKIKEMMDSAVSDRLVTIEETDDGIRYVPNFDAKLFGELTNDWFCFECHSVRDSEELIDCNKCFKAFHLNCLKGDHKVPNLKEELFECLYCRRSSQPDTTPRVNQFSKPELNKVVSFVINNLQLSYDPQIFESYSIEESERNRVLLFKPIDVMAIRHKALTDQYNSLEEAITDFKHFFHNFSISRRDSSPELRDFERRFNHEVKELKLCVDCYKYSSDITYDKADDPHNWFTLVCDPPHELVFAKYSKYPFWPAKVVEIKAGGKQYDVRFFDAPDFSRALIPLKRLRPIECHELDDEDNDLELPIQLMEKHIENMRAKGVYFKQTIVNPLKRSAKKRANTDPKSGSERPVKRSKKSTDK